MSSAYCHRILDGLWAAGVRDMVVTPGSRSTPLLLAALNSKLRLHSIIDERSAAFFALGRARAQGSKVALLCTSGSAGAHYLPALLEARYAEHCLVALTADRPPELQGTGANQTIDQRMLFAAACPPCVEIPVPEASNAAELRAGQRVYEAVALATGPLHINLAFRKPLEHGANEAVPQPCEWPAVQLPTNEIADDVLEELSEACAATNRGLIVCGPLADAKLAAEICDLARALGFPLLAESTSGARFVGALQEERVDSFTHILGTPALADFLAPELILQFGTDPASGPLLRWLEAATARRVRFTGNKQLRAPSERVEVLHGNARRACQILLRQATQPGSKEYLEAWRRAEQVCWEAVAKELARETTELSEALAIATVLKTLAKDTQLTLGNSLPIRTVDAVLPGEAARLRVLHQRGTSGIEGLIAGAIGSCEAGRNALLLGDVSCTHDLSSLALHRLADGPLVIIVIDNGGGKIFSHLPVATLGLEADKWRFWETPPQVNFELACQAWGVAYRTCDRVADLKSALDWAGELHTVSMVHVRVAPESMREFLSNVRGALA